MESTQEIEESTQEIEEGTQGTEEGNQGIEERNQRIKEEIQKMMEGIHKQKKNIAYDSRTAGGLTGVITKPTLFRDKPAEIPGQPAESFPDKRPVPWGYHCRGYAGNAFASGV